MKVKPKMIQDGFMGDFYLGCPKCKEIRLEQGKEYELTIRATYYDSDDLVLSFVNELSDIIVSVDDIINIEEAN